MSAFFSNRRICVTGGAGFLGRAVCARLKRNGAEHIFVPRSSQFDLTDPAATAAMYDAARPQVVVHLAAEVGGIGANQRRPGRYFYANMAMGLNVIEQARRSAVEKLVMVGTVCAYPKCCPTPFSENDLWQGYPEETNAPYGIAKRSLGVMLDAYHRQYGMPAAYVLPVNLYGPGDNFDPESSHVIAAMVRTFCEATASGIHTVTCWGSGEVTREFLYVDDAADGIVAATEKLATPLPVNLGSGREIKIRDLAAMIATICGFEGCIQWDRSKADGQPKRRLNTTRASAELDWQAKVDLEEGLRRTVDWWRSGAEGRTRKAKCVMPTAPDGT